MLKGFVAILLLLLIFCQSFNRFLVKASFYINQNYIATNLCVNRGNPSMHCDGKCQLTKKLNETDQQDQQNPQKRTANEMDVFFFHPIAISPVIVYIDVPQPLNGHYVSLVPQFVFAATLHPPTA